MAKIKLITDTASDLPLKQAEELGIELLSFHISINGDSYQEQRDLSKEEFYDLMAHSDDMPSTSQITAFTFQETFQKFYEEGYTDLIYVSINAGGSATYQNAVQARDMLYEEIPESKSMNIHIIDGENYTMCYGYPVVKAAEMIQNGNSVEEILNYIKDWISKIGVYFTPATLKYVRKSGRLTAVAAFAGEVLGLKPIIRISHGKISAPEKVRGEKNIVPKLTEKILTVMLPDSPYLIIQGVNSELADKAEEILIQKLGYPPVERVKVGSAVAVNAGYDLVGIAVLEKQN